MKRKEAIIRLNELVGKELHKLADQYGVTIYRNGKVNKGWALRFRRGRCRCKTYRSLQQREV